MRDSSILVWTAQKSPGKKCSAGRMKARRKSQALCGCVLSLEVWKLLFLCFLYAADGSHTQLFLSF